MKKILFILRVAILLPFAIMGVIGGAICAFLLEGVKIFEAAFDAIYGKLK